jgi:hypothetical protein
MEPTTMQAGDRGEGAPSPRAGDLSRMKLSGLSTPHAAGAIALGAVFVLVVIRRSFAGALGD